MFAIETLPLKRRKLFLLIHGFDIEPIIASFLEVLIHFFPSFQVFTQTSATGSLTGHLTRVAAVCQRFLMLALLGLLCLGFVVNYIVLQLTFGNRPECYPESA